MQGEVTTEQKWEAVKKHYESMGIKFEATPKVAAINWFYDELQKFNHTHMKLIKEDPEFDRKQDEAARLKSIAGPKPKLTVVGKATRFLENLGGKLSSSVESALNPRTD